VRLDQKGKWILYNHHRSYSVFLSFGRFVHLVVFTLTLKKSNIAEVGQLWQKAINHSRMVIFK